MNQIERLALEAAALVTRAGHDTKEITSIHTTADGKLGSVGVGVDKDGMAIFVLNFAL